MKFVSSQMAFFLTAKQTRQNLAALIGYVALLASLVVLYTVLFHVIMIRAEGEYHSWISGLYWTVVTMTTLGFGDITFQTDIGRLFSTFVLLSGVVLLLVLLPYLFIRLFLAPWLEARVRLRAPREAMDMADHVIICHDDSIAPGLVSRLRAQDIPYVLLEPDPAKAASLMDADIRVVTGAVDSRVTYERVRADRARLVFASGADTENTNITITVREIAPEVPIAAVVSEEMSVDILELSGCNHVLPLRQRLGEQLANRVNAGHARTHITGSFNGMVVAEFAVEGTPLAGRTVRETRLRAATGMSIIAVGERGRLRAASPGMTLSDRSVAVVMGTEEQLERLNELLVIYRDSFNPVLVIGGGTVGIAAVRALKRNGIGVHLVERDPSRADLASEPDRFFLGDAADLEVLTGAGIMQAPSVLLTTHDDAMNIYLAVYCRRLNQDIRIISRITHERNVEAVLRAGADFVMSYDALGVETVMALLHNRGLVILGEGVDLYRLPVPGTLAGISLGESGIGARTGMNVIAVQENGEIHRNPTAHFRLMAGGELFLLGSMQQREAFTRLYG